MIEDSGFASGIWRGFYNYQAGGVRHRQEMCLGFSSGVLTGDGYDGVGPFIVRGGYNAETRTVYWTKVYIGRHPVHYTGCLEGKGIWGTWRIQNSRTGGFMIWPSGLSGQKEDEVNLTIPAAPDVQKVAAGVHQPATGNSPPGAV